jgi:hypothetical protein
MSLFGRMVSIAALAAVCACHKEPSARSTPDEVYIATKPADPMQKGTDMNPDPAVMKALETKGYMDLFMTMDDEDLDEVWTLAGGAAGLEAVVGSAQASSKARYLAAEILFKKDPGYKPADAKRLASAYADALRDEEIANPWGMPGELDEPLGIHLVAFGEPAVAALRELLSNDRLIYYSGSKEATVGNSYQMRVKDFAAFFIARIRNLPFAMDTDPKQRDAAIAALQSAL